MDLKELNYVVTIANEGSISRAAEKLFMSQSSLSQAIRVLEQDLGTSVFVAPPAESGQLPPEMPLFPTRSRSCSSTAPHVVRPQTSKISTAVP